MEFFKTFDSKWQKRISNRTGQVESDDMWKQQISYFQNIDHCQKEGGILLMLMCHTYYFHILTTNNGVVTHL